MIGQQHFHTSPTGTDRWAAGVLVSGEETVPSICRAHFAMLVLLVVLLACAGDRVGRIADEYGYGEPQASLEPMVIVSGFLGSNLIDRESGHEVWGLFLAGEQRVWRAEVQRRIALPMTGGETLAEMRDEVVAVGVMQNGEIEIAGQRFTVNTYPGLLWGILRGLGEPGSNGDTPSKRELRSNTRAAESDSMSSIHGVAYDWRRDLSESAEALDVAVEAAHRQKLERGLEGDAARVDILAHSMGTLVTRYYLRYGTQTLAQDGSLPVLDWRGAKRVRRVVLVAPPNNGSLEAFRDVTQGGSPEFPIPSHPPALLATFASLYQMIPHAGSKAVVYADDGSPVDFYAVETWDRLGWGPLGDDQQEVLQNLLPDLPTHEARRAVARNYVELCLARAAQLNAALDIPSAPPAGTTMHLFMSDTVDTPGRVEVDRHSGELVKYDHERGDKTVTRQSALGRMQLEAPPRGRLESPVHWTSVHIVEGNHLSMVGSPTLLDDVLYLLLEAPAGAD
jgi:pimeloyl-ACP methyl ester carboxylesterase